MDLGTRATRVGALADPTRRALYEYVVGRSAPVGREEAAAALGMPAHTVKFHLDKLVTTGLLATEYRRLGGRRGPGAGRPSKLYRRADGEVAVSLPERAYDLVGHILAAGVERASSGESLASALDAAATDAGREVGATADGNDVPAFSRALAAQGFEPRVEGDTVLLANCPFDTLARRHTALVCGLNRSFVQGVADGVGCDVAARLDPEAGRCCVKGRIAPRISTTA
ncbi:helix-turn-helix domain-containing protein [Nocardioides sp. YIM 152315]|uniref:helix-turn-helix transcriptional regulator n=1 Tax=Nocardioides sp. YIM 152315 TaxID=3031760 RepID=UPI0023DA03A6|nr:helix-turn-helix domain-containing protein [Nocardioides sp. YIM 152315]MDF1602698.1 helix-turn-helix domain-containing protein [Nocardioides sp. YIM 152315]